MEQSITLNIDRVGNYTSSQIYKLTKSGSREMTEEEMELYKKDNPKGKKKTIDGGFSAGGLTYIEEVRAQRCLGRGIDTGAVSQALTWGKVMEHYCHKFELGIEYHLCSHDSIIHPKYPFWSGTPDVKTRMKTGEIKCPYPKAFYLLSKMLIKLNEGTSKLSDLKKEFSDYFWQPVSNAIINKHVTAELMVYTPSEEQLFIIRKELDETNIGELLGLNEWNYRFIVESPIEQLPYIPDGIEWPNFVKHTFEVSEEDKAFLTDRVLKAEKLLNYDK